MINLISKGDKHWESEDERVVVTYDDTFETECDEPHPVRMRAEGLTEKQRRKLQVSGAKFTTKHLKDGWVEYVSYQCLGGEVHYYGQWTVSIDGEWTDDVYDTFERALGVVEKQTGQKVKLVRQRKPKSGLREFIETNVVPSKSLTEDDVQRYILWDELQAIKDALVRYDEMMRSEDAPFVDQKLHEHHLRRKAEIEKLLV